MFLKMVAWMKLLLHALTSWEAWRFFSPLRVVWSKIVPSFTIGFMLDLWLCLPAWHICQKNPKDVWKPWNSHLVLLRIQLPQNGFCFLLSIFRSPGLPLIMASATHQKIAHWNLYITQTRNGNIIFKTSMVGCCCSTLLKLPRTGTRA